MSKKKPPRKSGPAPKTRLFDGLADLYRRMEEAYQKTADEIGLSCAGCADNCCVSYFQHHTYLEWAYVLQWLNSLDEPRKAEVVQRAENWIRQTGALAAQGMRPRIMCPLNEDGLCIAYTHRLMICRMHGVPNRLVAPNGRSQVFAGCGPCQKLTGQDPDAPFMDRTLFYRDLAALEMRFQGRRAGKLPKVDLALAEMLVQDCPIA